MGWEDQEMKHSNIGDKRLEKRLTQIVKRLSDAQDASLTQSFRSRAELVGGCRFFDNPRATPGKIIASHIENTKNRIKGRPIVLLPSDTSSIDYTAKKTVEGLGILETSFTYGLFVHPTMAFTPDKICLGCVDVKMWTRNPDGNRRKLPSQVRNNQPIEEIESFRWLQSYRVAKGLAAEFPETQFINMGDRENDILECIVEAVEEDSKVKAGKQDNCAYIILRINHDRMLMPEKNVKKRSKNAQVIETEEELEEELKLKKKLLESPIRGEVTFTMRSRENKPEREVTQKIRACKVRLQGKKVGDKTYPSVWINAVCAVEENPPEGEDPICWMFFTTLPIDTFAEVCNVIKYYLSRWGIETFFNILKNGCRIEERELKNVHRIKNMIALFMIVAWRVQYLMTLSRINPGIVCTEVFEEAEWKSVYKVMNKKSAIPEQPPTLGEIMDLVAHLGGYLEKRKTPPGPKIIWRGLKKMYDYAEAWDSFGGNVGT
jgi:hypothetical protein